MAGEFSQQNDRETRAILFVSSQKFSPSVEINGRFADANVSLQ